MYSISLIKSRNSDRYVSLEIRSVFDRYNIVSDSDLILVAQKQEYYLKSQVGTISGTIQKKNDRGNEKIEFSPFFKIFIKS